MINYYRKSMGWYIAYHVIAAFYLLCSGPARSQDPFTDGYDAGYRDGCFAGGGSINEKGDCVPSAPISNAPGSSRFISSYLLFPKLRPGALQSMESGGTWGLVPLPSDPSGKPPEIASFQNYQDLLRSLSEQPNATFDWNAYLADPDSALVGVPLQALDRSTISVEAFTFDPSARTVSKEVIDATELNQMLEAPGIE